MKTDFMIERDTIMTLGILARAYVDFDPPISTSPKAPHALGFNVHCLVLDNCDGEVLAVARNRIFAESDPLQHAEQNGIRLALTTLKVKRERPARMSVVDYYKSKLFMEPGTTDTDFALKGCTLYNTFDPCGFCATTLLVCYMKRIAYVFEDKKFSGVYDLMKSQYFKNRDSIKELTATAANGNGFIGPAGQLVSDLRKKVHDLEMDGTDLVLTLDRCRDDLAKASSMLASLTHDSLQTTDTADRARNLRTLTDVQRLVLGL